MLLLASVHCTLMEFWSCSSWGLLPTAWWCTGTVMAWEVPRASGSRLDTFWQVLHGNADGVLKLFAVLVYKEGYWTSNLRFRRHSILRIHWDGIAPLVWGFSRSGPWRQKKKTLKELTQTMRTCYWNQLEESSLSGQLTLEKCEVRHPRNTPLVTTEGRATVHTPGTPPQKTDTQNKQGLPE